MAGAMVELGIESPIGRLVLCGDGDALAAVLLPDATGQSAGSPRPPRTGRTARTGGPVPDSLRRAACQLEEYFAGSRKVFSLALAPKGTAFQLAVWRALEEIPYGEVATYGDLARRIGRASAARAVGQANGRNPLPIVYPCHRVVAAGGLGGYSGGLDVKRHLLALERAHR